MKPIPYGKQEITEEDISEVIKVLKSDYLTQGPKIEEFENSFSNYIGSKYSIACSNGTAALHLCTLALGLKKDDLVITSPITFVASANSVIYCGGEILFSDIDPDTYLIDLNYVEDLIKKLPEGKIKGLIPVDFAGKPVNLEDCRYLANKYNFWIIEDACHAPGGYFIDSQINQQLCGNGIFADLSVFSFHPVKHIACGEGGMITTNNKNLYELIIKLRTHGITKNNSLFKNSIELASGNQLISSEYPGWYMEMQELGYNYRLTDFQAALGLSQLKRLNYSLNRRHEIANFYSLNFKNKSYIKKLPNIDQGHALHLYVIEVEKRYELYNFLRNNNIYCQIHYIPAHLMPFYQNLGWKLGDLPNAEKYYSSCISLPMYPSLTEIELKYIVEKIDKFYNE